MSTNELKEAINNYFINSDFDIIDNNFNILLTVAVNTYNSFLPYASKCRENSQEIFPIYSIEERFQLIRNYFKKHNIDFDLDKLINDGTIGFNIETYEENIGDEAKLNFYLTGENYYGEHNQKLISVNNTGYIFDSAVLLHEISHYRNQPEVTRSRVNHLFTEAIAYTEEIIYLYDLYKNGYIEALYGIKSVIYTFFWNSSFMYPITKLFNLYYKLGDISKESYEMLYGRTNDYDKIIASQKKMVENQEKVYLAKNTYILIAGLLTPYLFVKYLEDETFMIKIQNLHEKICNCDNIIEILKSIDLDGNIFDIVDELTNYSEKFANEILNKNVNIKK